MYTWRKEWINKYESLWNVFEKFKYANSISEKEVYQLFSVRDQLGDIRNYQPKENKCYISMKGIDGNALRDILGIDIKQRNLSDIENISYIIDKHSNINIKDFFSNILRLCPECIKNGYHSVFHQVLLFDKCFIHEKVNLISKCPNCLCLLDYEFNKTSDKIGFQCKYCSSMYLESNNVKDVFNKWNVNEIELKSSVNKWVSLNKKYQNQNFTSELLCFKPENTQDYYNYYLKFIRSDILHDIFNLMEEELQNYQNTSIKLISCNRIVNSLSNYIIEDFEMEIFKAYKAIFKSIARRIRKKKKATNKIIKMLQLSETAFYQPHSLLNLANYLGRMPNRPNIDIPIYTYLMWRMDIEGLNEYTQVHRKSKYNKFTYNMEAFYLSTQDTEIYNYVVNELVRRLPNAERTVDSKSIIEHIIANLLLFHYKNWLYIAKFIKISEIDMKEKIPYIMPLFFIKKSSEYKNEIEIKTIDFMNRMSRGNNSKN